MLASRTRGQLQGYAKMIILPMSAPGSSLFPRFLMSPGLQKVGLVTEFELRSAGTAA